MLYKLFGRIILWIVSLFAGIFCKLPKCQTCRTRLEKVSPPKLYLIPARYDDDYSPKPEYYLRNCVPISDESLIPTGRRAVRIYLLRCPSCGNCEKVLVDDFLKVRNDEVLEKHEVFGLSDFKPLLYGTCGTQSGKIE